MTGRREVRGFSTIGAALEYAADSDEGVCFFSALGELSLSLTYRELLAQTKTAGRRLASLGLARGSRVALVAETGADFLTLFYGCQHAGLVPCPLPYITYIGGKDAYRTRLANLIRAADARLLCAPPSLRDVAADAAASGGASILSFDEFGALDEAATPTPLRSEDIAYIQFSSGSTSQPKGIRISQTAICANAEAILRHGMKLRDGDRAFSWLPFYHDMGLVGFSIAPLFGQCPVDYLAPSSFARRPNLWADLMSRRTSTITYAPTFGYRLAAQRFAPKEGMDLSSLRIAGIGGDMIRAEVLDHFATTMASIGFRRSAMKPSYGMAEATLAVSFAETLTTDPVDSRAMAANGLASRALNGSTPPDEVREFVVCGRAIPGLELIIAAPDGKPLPERQVGRILIRGPSIMSGYEGAEPLTRQVLRPDGFLDTGDLGYRVGDDVVVTGRTKDVIHHRGRNIWPEDIEWTAERVTPLRPGDVAAFAVPDASGDDSLVALVQTGIGDATDRAGLRQRVAAAVSEATGVACRVVLVPPGSLPYTSSGKLSRSAGKDSYLAGAWRDDDLD